MRSAVAKRRGGAKSDRADETETETPAKPSLPGKQKAVQADTALIFIPELGRSDEASVLAIAEKVAGALDHHDQVGENKYIAEPALGDLRYGPGSPKARAEYVHVTRKPTQTSETTEPYLDVFEFDYSDSLFKSFERKPAVVRGLRLSLAAGLGLLRMVGTLLSGERSKNRGWTIVNILLAFAMLVGVIAYAVDWDGQLRSDQVVWAIAIIGAAIVFCQIKVNNTSRTAKVVAPLLAWMSLASFHWDWFSGGWQTAASFALWVTLAVVVIQAFGNASDDTAELVQLAVAMTIVALLGASSLILLTGAGIAVQDLADNDDASTLVTPPSDEEDEADTSLRDAAPSGERTSEDEDGSEGDDVRDPLKALVLLGAAIGVLVPKKVRGSFADATTRLLGAVEWVSSINQDRRREIERLHELIEELSERDYHRIFVVGYSFGAVIALDAVFPIASAAPLRVQQVERVITVGCPSKTIATFWPDYWKKRHAVHGGATGKTRWTNVYAPLDVLSSALNPEKISEEEESDEARNQRMKEPWTMTYMSDDKNEATVRVPKEFVYKSSGEVDKLWPWEKLFLAGLRAHTDYWSNGQRGAVECFAGDLLSREEPSDGSAAASSDA